MTTITATIPVRFAKAPGLTNILDVIMPYGYHPAEGGEIYLDEHDGTGFISLWPAVKELFPKGSEANSNAIDEAWVAGYDIEQFDGMTATVKLTQAFFTNGDFSETAELINP